ncbi:MAG TPA: cation:proton antiporter [Actinomycetota bacterium]|nr:cation:proton antiporter [Actinomycetota bacterium]
MALSSADIARMLVALAMLLVSAHAVGQVFARFRQPRVVGEILGGLVLGPTFLGSLFPAQLSWVFPASGPVAAIIGAVYQLGLLLLMYCSGAEMRSLFHREERRTVAAVTVGGIAVPFLLGLVAVSVIDTSPLEGPAGVHGAFVLVFGIAIAVTSIPVISKILFDLGIIGTSFSRIVLGAAVVEDVVLYVALAVALAMASATQGGPFGLPSLLGIDPISRANVVYHVIAEIGFMSAALAIGPSVFGWTRKLRLNLVNASNPMAYQLAFMLMLSGLCAFIGVVPLFGALVAGLVAGASTDEEVIGERTTIKRFSFAFFIPIYFAVVGLQLDLARTFDPLFFAGFLLFATAVKAVSVYVSARLTGETSRGAANLAVAMNARGGPGIVLASVAFDAGIISPSFFASLVMLAVVTSLIAGSWLDRAVRSGMPLRGPGDPAARPQGHIAPGRDRNQDTSTGSPG